MKVEPSITYVSQGNSFYITIPKSRDLSSYPEEILRLLGDDLRESDTRDRDQFNDDEYRLQLNLRVYSTNKNKHRVQIKHTLKENDFTAIPNDILRKLGPLTQISFTSNINDLANIQEIISIGYRITPPL